MQDNLLSCQHNESEVTCPHPRQSNHHAPGVGYAKSPGMETAHSAPDHSVLSWDRPLTSTPAFAGRDPWGLLSCFSLYLYYSLSYGISPATDRSACGRLLNGPDCAPKTGRSVPSAWDTSARRPAHQSSPALCFSERHVSGSRLYRGDSWGVEIRLDRGVVTFPLRRYRHLRGVLQ
jgi:hypothetical protein